MSKRRRCTGVIPCEFCPKTIGGSSKSGVFSNYISHTLSAHPVERGEPYYRGPHVRKV